MRRLFAGLLCLPVLASAQTRPRKIFISADMEGITGVVQPAQLGPDGFEVHLVGGQDPPAAFVDGLRHPAVRLRGQISSPEHEFFSAHVLLAPNPTTTGASARILSGLTFGSCIVAHTDSVVGIPELAHGRNSLMAADGPGLARETLLALRDQGLPERLGDEARALYESSFSPPAAAGRIVAELERLAAAGSV